MSTSRCFGPRLGLLVVAELCGEAIECLVSIADLAVDQANAVDQGGDVSAGGLGRAVGDGDRLWRRMSRACAASRRRMRFGGWRRSSSGGHVWPCPGWGRAARARAARALPCRRPGRGRPGSSAQLLTHAIGETGAFGAEFLGNARPFAQLDDRIGGAETAEAMRIGAQGRRHDQAVAAVVPGAGRTVKRSRKRSICLGLMAQMLMLHQRLDHRRPCGTRWRCGAGRDRRPHFGRSASRPWRPAPGRNARRSSRRCRGPAHR